MPTESNIKRGNRILGNRFCRGIPNLPNGDPGQVWERDGEGIRGTVSVGILEGFPSSLGTLQRSPCANGKF